jgi:hypothetical protein
LNGSYIVTSDEIVVSINGKTYVANNNHIKYKEILQATKDEKLDVVPSLVEQDSANGRST